MFLFFHILGIWSAEAVLDIKDERNRAYKRLRNQWFLACILYIFIIIIIIIFFNENPSQIKAFV